jgi:hypothetical protein
MRRGNEFLKKTKNEKQKTKNKQKEKGPLWSRKEYLYYRVANALKRLIDHFFGLPGDDGGDRGQIEEEFCIRK